MRKFLEFIVVIALSAILGLVVATIVASIITLMFNLDVTRTNLVILCSWVIAFFKAIPRVTKDFGA